MKTLSSIAGLLLALATSSPGAAELLNASFDVARPFYKSYNAAFAAEWMRRTGSEPTLNVSHGVRPIDEQVLKANAARFPKLNVFTVEQGFGSWTQAQSVHFADGGLFDQLFAK